MMKAPQIWGWSVAAKSSLDWLFRKPQSLRSPQARFCPLQTQRVSASTEPQPASLHQPPRMLLSHLIQPQWLSSAACFSFQSPSPSLSPAVYVSNVKIGTKYCELKPDFCLSSRWGLGLLWWYSPPQFYHNIFSQHTKNWKNFGVNTHILIFTTWILYLGTIVLYLLLRISIHQSVNPSLCPAPPFSWMHFRVSCRLRMTDDVFSFDILCFSISFWVFF